MTTISNPDYYNILGISNTASNEEIKVAYKRKALRSHPDKIAQNKLTFEKATEVFKLVNKAYETLSDPQKRQLYDCRRSIKKSHQSTSFNPSFFGETFYATHKRSYPPECKSENDDEADFVPDSLSQEIDSIMSSDNKDVLDRFLKSKNFENSLLKSILYHACTKGKFNIVKYLIETKKLSAHLKVYDNYSFSGPIFKAAAESGNLDLVKYLLEVQHVDIESQGLTTGTQDTALSRAALQGHESVVKYLILKGANVNPEVSDSTILNCAISSKKLSVVRLLIEAGTEIDDFHLNAALEQGVLDIVQYLLKKRPGIKSHQYTPSPAYMAIRGGHVEVVKYLEETEGLNIFENHRHRDDTIKLLMMAAAESRSIEMMKFLLDERGLKEKVSNNIDYIKSILTKAIENEEHFYTKSEKQEMLKFVRFLMEERQFILPKEELKRIYKCMRSSSIEINSYLQSYLFDSNQIKSLLLTVAHQGLEGLNFAELLKLYNLKILNSLNFEVHKHIEERQISLEQLRDLCVNDKQMMTEALLYYSNYFFNKDLSKLKLLLELGVDLNAKNDKGIAAIHIALQSGGYNQIVQFYIDNKADLSSKNEQGQTFTEVLG